MPAPDSESLIQRLIVEADSCFRAGDEASAVRLLLEHVADLACAVRLREWAVAERRLDVLPRILDALVTRVHPEGTVSRAVARQLRGDAEGALELLKPLLGSHPELATAHHHAGRALHNLRRRSESLAALRIALQLSPHYAEARYSLAHALRASGRMDESIAAYRAAVEARPGMRMALLNLGITLCAAEQPAAALEVFDRLLKIAPELVDGWINRGLCLHILGQNAAARDCHEEALKRDPQHPLAHFYLGSLLNEQMDSAGAQHHLQAALQVSPHDPDILTEMAGLMEQLSELQMAQDYVDRGLASAPGHPGLELEAARLARRAGRMEEARRRLLSIHSASLPARMAQQYWFECALMHDRSGEYASTMQALERANTLAAASPRRRAVDHAAFPRRLREIEGWLRDGAPGGRPQPGDPSAQIDFKPAFLFGLPRSGTTLLDTMLDAHPGIASIEEKPTLETAVDGMTTLSPGFADRPTALGPADLARLQRRYAEQVRRWVPPAFSAVVLDKLPLRLLRAPLIHRLFPQAAFLFVLRHPCDVVISNVMQQYRPTEAFVHFDTLEAAANIYAQVMQVWRLMVETLSLPVHYVRYEDLVAQPEATLQAACSALGLGMLPGMLDPAQRLQSRARIQTNSYQQVAEPIYRRAAGRWHHYRQWLDPLLPVLRPHIEWLQYDID